MLELTVHADDAWALDRYSLRITDRTAENADVQPKLLIVLPDQIAGRPALVEVRGMVLGRPAAYGSVEVTPRRNETTFADVTLAMTSCDVACEPDATACCDDGLATCEKQVDGCYRWGAPITCPEAMRFCSNGACAAECTDECTMTASTCDGAARKTCGDFDADSCLDWSQPTACGANQICEDGACTSPGCTATSCIKPPTATCLDTDTKRTFSSPGTCEMNGTCSYAPADADCYRGCVGGKCRCECDEAVACCRAVHGMNDPNCQYMELECGLTLGNPDWNIGAYVKMTCPTSATCYYD